MVDRRRFLAPIAGLALTRLRPGVVVIAGFASAITIVTGLLMLPAAHQQGVGTTFREALFTATSAVCVTGLVVVDTPTHWSTFGQVIILGGIQFGGLGFMTSTSLLGLLVARRLGLRSRVVAAAETRAVALGDVRRVIRGVALVSLSVECLVAIPLALRFWLEYDEAPARAVYHGVFHAISAFNNAGFALYSDNLIGFATDPYVCLPLAVATIVGGLGFPVLFELRRELGSPRRWSLHTKTTILTSALLLVGGTAMVTGFEWRNAGTLGSLSIWDKLLVGFFQGGVQPRTVMTSLALDTTAGSRAGRCCLCLETGVAYVLNQNTVTPTQAVVMSHVRTRGVHGMRCSICCTLLALTIATELLGPDLSPTPGTCG